MESFHKKSDRELLEIRNNIFLESGIPSLKIKGFAKSPFTTSWFGKNNTGGYSYEFCRLSEEKRLEFIEAYITKGDRWIKIYLNIFELIPAPKSLEQLNGVDGLKFHLPPNSVTRMRLRVDDFKGIPLFNFKKHKLKSFNSESGLKRRTEELGNLIKQDLMDIDSFVLSWYELHQPNVTDWNGGKLE